MLPILIPVFPLKAVLFPGTLIRLQIVEPRYQALVDAAVSDYRRCFGATLLRPEGADQAATELHPVGTVAQILHLKREANNNINVLAIGKERVRILSFAPGGKYPMATVEEAPIKAVASPQVRRLERKVRAIAREYFSLLLNLNDQDTSQLKLPSAAVPLANFIGANVQISLARRQHLLECNELEALLDEEARLLESELHRIQWFESQRKLRPKGPAPYSLN